MPKAITLLIIGIVVGAGAMLLVGEPQGGGSDGSRSLFDDVAGAALGRDQIPAAATIDTATMLAIYREAQAASDIASLRRALEAAASAPRSRDVEIDALLTRLAELAPADAAQLARSLSIDTRFLADTYLRWAEVDPQAALNGLDAIGARIQRRDVALALLEVFGDDTAGFTRVSEVLAESERASLQVEWLGQRAENDPLGAFRQAQTLNGVDLQQAAFLQIATVWSKQDPLGALSQADSLPSQVQSQYRIRIFEEWARQDGNAYLAWLESVASPPREAVVGIRMLASSRPEYVMSMADRLTGEMADSLRSAAMMAMAEVDPEAAMARAEGLPPGQQRDMTLMAIGSVIARRDPDAALAWAEGITPPSRNLMTQVALAIAQTYPERAVEFFDNPPAGMDPNLISSLVISLMGRDPERAQTLADKLVASDNLQSVEALRRLVGNWMQQDPERALDWVLAHESQVNAGVLGSAAQTMARSDPRAAARFVDRIPAEYRTSWITQVAGPYAVADPAAALAWVSRFQGQEIYEAAMRQVIMGSAQTDPRSAAVLLDQASAETQLAAGTQVAQMWANRDPRAAARWTQTIDDSRARSAATNAAVMIWAANDPSAAQNWVMDLERGEARDQALNALVLRISSSGNLDRSLLTAFSGDNARQEALRRVIPNVSRNDPEEAAELLELVTNSNTRRQIEEQIELVNATR